MFFFNAVMVEDNIYGIAKLYMTKARASIGMNLYRIESDGRDTWDSCYAVTGGIAEYAGWIDGDGNSVHITCPHAMNHLPGTNSIIMTDIDNCTIRVANVGTTPVHVTTVLYNEDLWNKLYVSKLCDKPQKNGTPHKLLNVRSSNNFLQAGVPHGRDFALSLTSEATGLKSLNKQDVQLPLGQMKTAACTGFTSMVSVFCHRLMIHNQDTLWKALHGVERIKCLPTCPHLQKDLQQYKCCWIASNNFVQIPAPSICPIFHASLDCIDCLIHETKRVWRSVTPTTSLT